MLPTSYMRRGRDRCIWGYPLLPLNSSQMLDYCLFSYFISFLMTLRAGLCPFTSGFAVALLFAYFLSLVVWGFFEFYQIQAMLLRLLKLLF